MKTRRSSLLLVKQQQKAASEELRKRNLGVGLVIDGDAVNNAAKKNKTTVFDDEFLFEEEDPIVDASTADNEQSPEDDSAVEEVPLEEARKAVQSQQTAERAFQIATKRKRKKNKKLPSAEHHDNDDDDNLDDELFALLDANRMQTKINIRDSKQSSVAVAAENKRTTFVLESSDTQTIVRNAGGFHIDVVVLDAKDGAQNDPMGFTIGTKPSKVALLLSTTNNNNANSLMQGLKTSKKAKYGASRGRPSRLFSQVT